MSNLAPFEIVAIEMCVTLTFRMGKGKSKYANRMLKCDFLYHDNSNIFPNFHHHEIVADQIKWDTFDHENEGQRAAR